MTKGTITSTTIILLSTLLISVAAMTHISNNANASSIVGNYADGYEEGKDNGADDRRSGNEHDSKCPNDSLSWCTGYKVGYEVGWVAAGALGD